MSSASAFGFEVPQGNSGELDAAASSWRALEVALGAQGEAVAAGAELALGAGAWEGAAASSFGSSSERLVGAFSRDVEACSQAASALTQLARALEQAQQATRQALTACEHAQAEATQQQQTADQAGQTAQSARQAASTAVHPSTVSALSREASIAEQQQGAAQGAANQAQGDLTAARNRGIQAVTAYEHEAQAVAARLRAVAGELRPVTDLAQGWAEPVVTWAGHGNDFAGAGATGLIKSYDALISRETNTMMDEIDEFLRDPGAWINPAASPFLSAVDDGGADGALAASTLSDARFSFAADLARAADSPLSKALTTGLPEDTFGVLGKVPYLGWAFTGADMFMHRNDGIGAAVIQPVGNLAVGTGIAEVTSSAIAPVVSSDAVITAVGGSALIPGVGEVVITGAVVVGGVMAVDWGATEIWNHRAAIAHGVVDAWHGVEHGADWAYNEGKSVVHGAEHLLDDLDPF